MKTINEMKITIQGRSVNEAFARSAVAAFASPLDPTLEEINDIKTSVSEAVTNCIVHGYPDRIGNVYITVRIKSDKTLEIIVSDKGKGIEDIELAKTPLYTTSQDGERSGMGFTIMESLMDKVKVYSKPEKGTRVRMEKLITSKKSK